MKNKILLIGIFSFFMTACAGAGAQVDSMTIKQNSGPLPPEFYTESVMIIIPDYEANTLHVSFNLKYPYNEKSEAVKKKLLIEDGETFDLFNDVGVFAQKPFKTEDDGCVGGHNYETEVEVDGKFFENSYYVCGQNAKVKKLDDFYLMLEAKLRE